ncbi:MAG: ribosome biogenesis GTPase YlqF [Lachnospiraceae bacterium]|nr:ribosome biogenesis GTPase YlqF [Lachnospiraceae bacterium]
MNYQWYPGHMTKAVRAMQEQLKLIDLVIELVDARIPFSSRNPDIDQLGKGKYRILVLNKADLADASATRAWKSHYEMMGLHVLELNAKKPDLLKTLKPMVLEVCADKIERDRKRGIKNRPIRAMVCGIPNVGKSTFINSIVRKSIAKTGNRPGVTRANQWIRTDAGIELLDTPGILWPKFEDQVVGRNLAFIGSMNDEILIPEELATDFLMEMERLYPGALASYYKVQEEENAADLLRSIAIARGCIKKGEEPDLEKASNLIMEDFRMARPGRFTMEKADHD